VAAIQILGAWRQCLTLVMNARCHGTCNCTVGSLTMHLSALVTLCCSHHGLVLPCLYFQSMAC
jgi:hypothetical protein